SGAELRRVVAIARERALGKSERGCCGVTPTHRRRLDEAQSGGRPRTSEQAFDTAVDQRPAEDGAEIDRPRASVAIGGLGIDDFRTLDDVYMRRPACDALAQRRPLRNSSEQPSGRQVNTPNSS